MLKVSGLLNDRMFGKQEPIRRGPDGQWLEAVVRTPEGPAILRTVPCRFVPLVAGR